MEERPPQNVIIRNNQSIPARGISIRPPYTPEKAQQPINRSFSQNHMQQQYPQPYQRITFSQPKSIPVRIEHPLPTQIHYSTPVHTPITYNGGPNTPKIMFQVQNSSSNLKKSSREVTFSPHQQALLHQRYEPQP